MAPSPMSSSGLGRRLFRTYRYPSLKPDQRLGSTYGRLLDSSFGALESFFPASVRLFLQNLSSRDRSSRSRAQLGPKTNPKSTKTKKHILVSSYKYFPEAGARRVPSGFRPKGHHPRQLSDGCWLVCSRPSGPSGESLYALYVAQ